MRINSEKYLEKHSLPLSKNFYPPQRKEHKVNPKEKGAPQPILPGTSKRKSSPPLKKGF
jgi:hypothetical protein